MRPITLVFLLLLATGCVAHAQELYTYTNPLNAKVITVGVNKKPAGSFVALGDIAQDAKFCAEDSEFYCVNSDVYHFAVPKKLSQETNQWSIDGRLYKVIERKDLYLLGEKHDVIVIKSVLGETVYRSFYSESKGVVAIGAYDGDYSSLFILTATCGLAAPKTCQ